MFTMVSYHDTTQHDDLAAIAATPDPHIRVSGNDIYVPMWNKMAMVWCGGTNLSDLRMQSPSLRRLANQRITTIMSTDPPNAGWQSIKINDFHERPRTLDIAEALNAFCANSMPADEYVLVWLMDALAPLPAGEIFSIEGDVTVVCVKAQWVNAALTFTQTLPAGRYALVGMRSVDTEVVAVRCVFPDISVRPGCVSSYNHGQPSNPIFRQGALGNWGEFEHDAPPSMDVLGSSAGEKTPEITMDLIQTRAGRRA